MFRAFGSSGHSVFNKRASSACGMLHSCTFDLNLITVEHIGIH